jgi:hypothetical protein
VQKHQKVGEYFQNIDPSNQTSPAYFYNNVFLTSFLLLAEIRKLNADQKAQIRKAWAAIQVSLFVILLFTLNPK